MPNNKQSKKPANQKMNPLLLVAVAVAAVAVSLVLFAPKGNSSGNTVAADPEANQAVLNEDGDIVIKIADITEKAAFYEYDANGTTMGLFAVKAGDGTIRTALNTCQVCNGSPYAYFEQQDDSFQCQNCNNLFSLDKIEQERGGCNPVPITADEKTVNDTEIIIPAEFMEENAERFENWKNF